MQTFPYGAGKDLLLRPEIPVLPAWDQALRGNCLRVRQIIPFRPKGERVPKRKLRSQTEVSDLRQRQLPVLQRGKHGVALKDQRPIPCLRRVEAKGIVIN